MIPIKFLKLHEERYPSIKQFNMNHLLPLIKKNPLKAFQKNYDTN